MAAAGGGHSGEARRQPGGAPRRRRAATLHGHRQGGAGVCRRRGRLEGANDAGIDGARWERRRTAPRRQPAVGTEVKLPALNRARAEGRWCSPTLLWSWFGVSGGEQLSLASATPRSSWSATKRFNYGTVIANSLLSYPRKSGEAVNEMTSLWFGVSGGEQLSLASATPRSSWSASSSSEAVQLRHCHR
uniref:Uncharacterized protein n=1 Tax=Oryza barthii TaxID=65489 RepID=A0A0D3HSA2_9ORYZ